MSKTTPRTSPERRSEFDWEPLIAALADIVRRASAEHGPIASPLRGDVNVAASVDPVGLAVTFGPVESPKRTTVTCFVGCILPTKGASIRQKYGWWDDAKSWELTAVMLALEVLRGEESAVRTALGVALETPPWQRDLGAVIDAMTAPLLPVHETYPDARLGWLLSPGYAVNIEAATVRPRAISAKYPDGGYHVAKLHQRRRNSGPLPVHHPSDSLAITWTRSAGRYGGNDFLDAVVTGLVGHPRVFWREDKRTTHVTLRLSPIQVATSQQGGDSAAGNERGGPVSLGIRFAEHFFTFTQFSRLFGNLSYRDLLVLPAIGSGEVWVGILSPQLKAAIARARERGLDALPPGGGAFMVRRLGGSDASERLYLNESQRGEEVPPDPTLRIRAELKPKGADGQGRVTITAVTSPVAGGAFYPLGQGPAIVYRWDEERAIHCVRDHADELRRAEVVAERLGLQWGWMEQPAQWGIVGRDDALAVLAAVREAGYPLEWTTHHQYTTGGEFDPIDLEIRTIRKRKWFHLRGRARRGKHAVDIGDLLRAIKARKRFVAVADGGGRTTWMAISEKLSQHLSVLSAAGSAERGGLKVPAVAGPILAAAQDDGIVIEGDAWQQWRKRFEARDAGGDGGLSLVPPAGLRAQLRDYQGDGYRWLRSMASWAPGAILADDMGLGKTVQALALMLSRGFGDDGGPALVVAPTSVGTNWIRELERFAPTLKVHRYGGVADTDVLEREFQAGDVLLTTYDLAAREVEKLSMVHWSTLVLDEAQAIKNPGTRRAKAIAQLDADFCLALTGTPVENRSSEIWSLFQLVAPGLLGTYTGFRKVHGYAIDGRQDPRARDDLASLMRPFILRRLKGQVAKELPPRTEVSLDVPMADHQGRRYLKVLDAIVRALKGRRSSLPAQTRSKASTVEMLQSLTRLRQIACDLRLIDPRSREVGGKIRALIPLVRSLIAEGHRALIFSQFTSFLALVKQALDAEGITYHYMDGTVTARKRQREIDAFQAGGEPLFLLSLKAGGVGLNLTAADYVIHLDPWWNPAVEDQATDRAHRIGQTRPVTVYRMVAADSVEQAIMEMHREKRELADALLAGTDGATPVTAETIEQLLMTHRLG